MESPDSDYADYTDYYRRRRRRTCIGKPVKALKTA
jgi:hypothetical protein